MNHMRRHPRILRHFILIAIDAFWVTLQDLRQVGGFLYAPDGTTYLGFTGWSGGGAGVGGEWSRAFYYVPADEASEHYISVLGYRFTAVLYETRVILGEPIAGDLVVMNISPKRIRIQAAAAVSEEEAAAKKPVETESAPATPKTLLSLKARYREFWPNYMLFESEEFKNIVVDSDIVLESGESRKFPFSIDSLSIHPELNILREYEVSGNLHSADLMIGDEAFQGRLQFRSGAAFVFPRNAEHLGDDPLKRLTSAFEKRAALHLTIVGGWIDATTRELALTLLGDALVDPAVSETMKTAAMATLRVVTGENLAGTAEAWGGYLRSRRPSER